MEGSRGPRDRHSGFRGASPAQILLVLLILAVVALVVIVAWGRVAR